MKDRYYSLTNQITVFVTNRILVYILYTRFAHHRWFRRSPDNYCVCSVVNGHSFYYTYKLRR